MEVHSLMMHLHFIFGVFLPVCGTRRTVSDRLGRMVDTWCFIRQNARMNIKRLTRGNIDTRTEEHKANAMKHNKINFCPSAPSVLLSLIS